MREKIFRGKRKDNGKWVYGFYALFASNKGLKHGIYTGAENGCVIPYEVDPETVGQFTGLHDKNGNKIFEGDILEDVLCGDKERYTVIFDDYCRYVLTNNGTRNYLLARNNKDMEVIGNIHDKLCVLQETQK